MYNFRKFNFETFKQILYVVPHFYVYKWIDIESVDFKLIVNFPVDYKEREKVILN